MTRRPRIDVLAAAWAAIAVPAYLLALAAVLGLWLAARRLRQAAWLLAVVVPVQAGCGHPDRFCVLYSQAYDRAARTGTTSCLTWLCHEGQPTPPPGIPCTFVRTSPVVRP